MKTGFAVSENLPTALKLLRTKAGLTQREVAERIGVTKSQVSKYEKGKSVPRMENLLKLLSGLDSDLHGLQRAVEYLEKERLRQEGGS